MKGEGEGEKRERERERGGGGGDVSTSLLFPCDVRGADIIPSNSSVDCQRHRGLDLISIDTYTQTVV